MSNKGRKIFDKILWKSKKMDDGEIKKPMRVFRWCTFVDYVLLFTSSISAIIHGAGMPAMSLVFGNMLGQFILLNNPANLTADEKAQVEWSIILASLIFGGLAIIMAIASYVQIACSEAFAERYMRRLRSEYFKAALRQEQPWYDRHGTANIANRLNDDVEHMREGMGDKLSLAIQHLSTFIAGYVIAFIRCWQLTLVLMSLAPITIIVNAYMGKIISSITINEQKRYAKASTIAQESISAVRTIHALNAHHRQIARYSQHVINCFKTGIKRYFITFGAMSAFGVVEYASYALSFFYGAKLIVWGIVTDPGLIITCMFSVMQGSNAFGQFVPLFTSFADVIGCSTKVFEVVNSVPNIDNMSTDGKSPKKIRGEVLFKNITFTYPQRPGIKVIFKYSRHRLRGCLWEKKKTLS